MRIAPRSSRFAIFSRRALTASAAEAASADKSSGPPVVARNPTWLGSTKIEIVMSTSDAQGLLLLLLYSTSQIMRSESARLPNHFLIAASMAFSFERKHFDGRPE